MNINITETGTHDRAIFFHELEPGDIFGLIEDTFDIAEAELFIVIDPPNLNPGYDAVRLSDGRCVALAPAREVFLYTGAVDFSEDKMLYRIPNGETLVSAVSMQC